MLDADLRVLDPRLAEPLRHVLAHHNPRYTLREIANFALAETLRSLLDEMTDTNSTDPTLTRLIRLCNQVSAETQGLTP